MTAARPAMHLCALLLMAGAATGCAANAAPLLPTGVPALEAPAPPARVVVPTPEPPPPLPQTEEAAPTASSSSSTAKPPSGRDTSPPPRPVVPPPASDPPPAAPTPPSVLRTTANTAAREKQVQDLLTQARTDLLSVRRQSLGPDARAQFDSAAGFIRQAEEALKVKNLVYAGQLADKAATMAALLRRGS